MIVKNKKITISNGIIVEIEDIENDIVIINNNSFEIYHNCILTPNFTDSHCHIWGLGMKYLGADLSNASTIEECINIVIEKKFFKGDWLIGRGWNEELWHNKLPCKEDLDIHFPDIPVCLTRIDGHSIWVNSKAIEISNVNSNLTINGGEILKNNNGDLKGIFVDNAMQLIEKNIPNFTKTQLEQFILKGIEKANQSGITQLHDMDVSKDNHEILIKLDQENRLNAKVYSYLTAQNREYLNYSDFKYTGKNYCVRGIKLYADGALGSRGAALSEEYADYNSNGLILIDENEMYEICYEACNFGFDIAIHAIGDKAVEKVLNVFIKLRENNYKNVFRIEHSQLVQPEYIDLYQKYSIIASVQPIHYLSDYEMAIKRLGKDRLNKIGYLWNSFLDKKVIMIAGSDFPIETESVLLGINSFINRQDKERITLTDALNSYTIIPNNLVNLRNGYLVINKTANFNIISNFSHNTLKNAKVEQVFFEGKALL